MEERVHYIDIVKGLAMLFIIAMHSRVTIVNNMIMSAIITLTVPSFFVVSGYFLSCNGNWSSYLKKQVRQLIYPYFFFALSFGIVLSIYYSFKSRQWCPDYIFDVFIGPYLSNIKGNGPLWFLIVLFEIKVLWFFIARLQSEIVKAIIVVAMSIVGFMLGHHHFFMPFYLTTTMICFMYAYIGYLLNKIKGLTFNRLSYILIPILFIVCCYFHDENQYYAPYFNNYFLLYIPSLCGVISLLLFCKLVNKSYSLEYIGRNSLCILGVHFILIIVSIPICSLFNLGSMFMGLFIFTFSVFSSICFAILYNRYNPFVVGNII